MSSSLEWLSPEELAAELLDRAREIPVNKADELLACATGSIVQLGVADYVSILERVGDHEFTTRAPTDEHATTVDKLQREFLQGPCVEASYEEDLVVSGDVESDSRWPQWGPAAVQTGIAAVMSVQLYTQNNTMGALNMFYRTRQAFTAEDLDRARALAVPISIELAHTRDQENLWKAVEARTAIGQAQGILMERFGVDAVQAFNTLRRLSQQSNTKLSFVAGEIIRTRQLPGEASGTPSN